MMIVMNKIEEFLENYPSSKSTRKAYRTHLNKFFSTIEADPEQYFDNGRDYEQDVKTFWKAIIDEPPCTRNMRISCIRTFLTENDVDIKPKVWTNFRKRAKGNRPVTQDLVPTNIQLKKILTHGGVKERALFLIASSSGMRIDEILHLKESDIDMNSKPVKISIRGETTKTGNPRIAFMSEEAKTNLEEWLKVRDEYLNVSVKRANFKHYTKTADSPYIFPFTYATALIAWNRLIRKAGYTEREERTNRHKMHIHTLRKYFRTRMSLEIPVDVVEALMGHEGYLTQAYRRYSPQQLAELYEKAVHTISIFDVPADTTDLKILIGEKEEEIHVLRRELNKMKSEMGDYRERNEEIHRLKTEMETTKAEVGDFNMMLGNLESKMQMLKTLVTKWDKLQTKQLKKI